MDGIHLLTQSALDERYTVVKNRNIQLKMKADQLRRYLMNLQREVQEASIISESGFAAAGSSQTEHDVLSPNDEDQRLISSGDKAPRNVELRVHTVFAYPLVQVDNLGDYVGPAAEGDLVTETRTAFKRMMQVCEASDGGEDGSRRINVKHYLSSSSPSCLLQLRLILEEDCAAGVGPRSKVTAIQFWLGCGSSVGSDLRNVKCLLEDEDGRGHFHDVETIVDQLGMKTSNAKVPLVLVHSTFSRVLGEAILKRCPPVKFVVCMGESSHVTMDSYVQFTSRFFNLLGDISVRAAFEEARKGVRMGDAECCFLLQSPSTSAEPLWKLQPAPSISPISTRVGDLLGNQGNSEGQGSSHHRLVARKLSQAFVKSPHFDGSLLGAPTPLIGRQTDLVRICNLLRVQKRRVLCVVGGEGMGKKALIVEAARYFSLPGGRFFSGGVALVSLPTHPPGVDSPTPENESALRAFLEALNLAVKLAIEGLQLASDEEKAQSKNTDSFLSFGSAGHSSQGGIFETRDQAFKDRVMEAEKRATGYRVFGADFFDSQTHLTSFLKSYSLSIKDTSKLYNEIQHTGTQLQEWGPGLLIRVVHVVRLMVMPPEDACLSGEREVLVERKDLGAKNGGHTRLMSKKFDPITENILEVSGATIKKELGPSIPQAEERLELMQVTLRNRKPLIEVEKSSPSYPGLATKYVLYTVEAIVSGLPISKASFSTTERLSGRTHFWEWVSEADCVRYFMGGSKEEAKERGLQLKVQGAPERRAEESPESVTNRVLERRLRGAMKEWASLAGRFSSSRGFSASALVVPRMESYLKDEKVRATLGMCLSLHPSLRILMSCQSAHWHPRKIFDEGNVFKTLAVPLDPLSPSDAALLFAENVKRPLGEQDFVKKVGERRKGRRREIGPWIEISL